MTSDTFIRQCQLRADAYCRTFGLDRVSVPEDEDEAIKVLKTVASVCQPTPEATTAVAEAEEQWAIDWLMDPPPEPVGRGWGMWGVEINVHPKGAPYHQCRVSTHILDDWSM